MTVFCIHQPYVLTADDKWDFSIVKSIIFLKVGDIKLLDLFLSSTLGTFNFTSLRFLWNFVVFKWWWAKYLCYEKIYFAASNSSLKIISENKLHTIKLVLFVRKFTTRYISKFCNLHLGFWQYLKGWCFNTKVIIENKEMLLYYSYVHNQILKGFKIHELKELLIVFMKAKYIL